MKAATADLMFASPDIKKQWGWDLTLGIAMIVLGIYALYAARVATIGSVIALGVILCLVGIIGVVTAFMMRNAGHLFLMLLASALYLVVGVMLAQHPSVGAQIVTLLLAVLFVFDGIFRFVAALWLQFPQWGWVAASGVITFVLGLLLWAGYPNTASWFIGFAVGINLIVSGIAWSAFAIKLKNVTAAAA